MEAAAMRKVLVQRLRRWETMRQEVAALDWAVQQLTPAERLVLQRLVLNRTPNGSREVCDVLDVELSTVYRRKREVLDKLCGLLEMGSEGSAAGGG